MDDNIAERLAVVETEVRYLREDINELKTKFSNFKKEVYRRLNNINRQINDLHLTMNNHSSLSGKEKAAIIVALITSISSIIVAVIQTLAH